MMNLTDPQLSLLRRINWLELHGWKEEARALLAEYRKLYPEKK